MAVEIICKSCGTQEKNAGKGLCRRCWSRQYVPPIGKCLDCGQEKPLEAKKKCKTCYNKSIPRPIITCLDCGFNSPHCGHGKCGRCYDKWARIIYAERISQYNKQYRKTPKGKAREKNKAAKRRSRLKTFPPISASDYQALITHYESTCFYCEKALTEDEITIDHVTPLVKGGHHALYNLVLACRTCNSRKQDVSIWAYVKKHPITETKLAIIMLGLGILVPPDDTNRQDD